jgi:GT2 family glycosyltransferase
MADALDSETGRRNAEEGIAESPNPSSMLDDFRQRMAVLETELQIRNMQIDGLAAKVNSLEKDLQLKINEFIQNLVRLHEDRARLQSELSEIKGSFAYRLMRVYASKIDRLFPDATSRGMVRKKVTAALNPRTASTPSTVSVRGHNKVQQTEFGPLTTLSYDSVDPAYNSWIHKHAPVASEVKASIERFSYRPKISVVMPVFNPEPKFLWEAIASVERQLYGNWELCICDDGSTRPEISGILENAMGSDQRIKVTRISTNQGIVAATNAALALVEGEYIAFLDHDDVIYDDALFEVVKLLNENPEFDYVYTDEDKIDLQGKRAIPFFKPDWSPDLLLSANYVTHLSVYRTKLLREIGGLRAGFEGSQDYDLVLRAKERSGKIGHVRKVVYGWRMTASSAAMSESAKPLAYVSAVRALRDAMRRRNIEAEVAMLPIYRYRVRYAIKGNPLVSIIIIATDKVIVSNCLRGIQKSRYGNYEIIVVNTTD